MGTFEPWNNKPQKLIVLPFARRIIMKDPYSVAFGDAVRDLRKSRGLSQEAFADLVGLDRSYMGRIERGEKNITLVKIFQLSNALGITPVEIFQHIQLKEKGG